MIWFEWDEAKAESNRRKHGVSFDLAVQVFDDPNLMAEQDRIVDGEARWRSIGMAAGIAVLVVGHTVRGQGEDEIIRIIKSGFPIPVVIQVQR
ncbi:MAG: BrnT family toxin [Acidobacteriaceae bacterium]